MNIVYMSQDEVIVVDSKYEDTMIKEYFTNGDRDINDYIKEEFPSNEAAVIKFKPTVLRQNQINEVSFF